MQSLRLQLFQRGGRLLPPLTREAIASVLSRRAFTSRKCTSPALRTGSRTIPRYAFPRFPPSQTRHASTNQPKLYSQTGFRTRRYLWGLTFFVVGAGGLYYITDTRASIHQYLTVPLIRWAYDDAEAAHIVGVSLLELLWRVGLYPRERSPLESLEGGGVNRLANLSVDVFGHHLSNPIGISAGLDKDGSIPSALFALGPSIVEIGGITPRPQFGNEKPRVFRIPSQRALINRYGLNSAGAEAVASRLRQRVREYAVSHGLGRGLEAERAVLDGHAGVPAGSLQQGKLLAVQIAKQKETNETDLPAVIEDYVFCVSRLGLYADILVVNVSSPNTPGLRTLQASEPLTQLLTAVVRAARSVDRPEKPRVMVKVSPDEDTDEQVSGIARAVWASGVDGVVVGNTTKKRPDPLPRGYVLRQTEATTVLETGGYSGPQMFERTLELVKRYKTALDPDIYDGPRDTSSSAEAAEGPEKHMQRLKNALDISHASKGTAPMGTVSTTQSASSTASKVIFATGGITNGEQALQVLNAGASVVQMYTALVYGGLGAVTAVKGEMRQALAQGGKAK